MKYAVPILVCVFFLGVVAYLYNVQHTQPNPGLPMQTITVGGKNIKVEIASTEFQRDQGLSDRTALPVGRGMLFVFDPARKVAFWMKDMRFSIDMIFADEQGVIVKIYTNVSPESYFNQKPPQTFPSGTPVRYVLEVPAGYVEAQGIAIGQKIVVK
ncbi:DUF192 domain-containing protein [Patescibacteria group bacterium]|nr:DUF192 domain-containing protein [Patescibacteria group bacterium]